MSLIDSLNAATAGLNSQSAWLANISDNVANSQTTGFKETNTSFEDVLSASGSAELAPGAVVAETQATNSVQGSVTQVTNATSLAISGSGFFAVQQPTGQLSASGQPALSPQQYYTRVGDFTPNAQGYLVNSTGYVLDGYPVSGGVTNTTALAPIQISKAPSVPQPTANVTLAANLPATPPAGTTSYTSTEQVYDAAGNPQQLTLDWAQVPTNAGSPISSTNPAVPNQWNLTVSAAGSSTPATGPVLVTFGSTPATAGTITALAPASSDPAGTVPTTQSTGSAASVALALNFGSGAQNVNLNLGSFGSPNGLTQFSGSTYQVSSLAQDGASQGNFSSVSIQASGAVVINYDNGQTATVAQVPLANFNDPNGLQGQNGQAYIASEASGSATMSAAGAGGTGTLLTSSVEGSNVDISTEFTQMIVAQQAYTANTKIIATANTMLQSVLNMVSGYAMNAARMGDGSSDMSATIDSIINNASTGLAATQAAINVVSNNVANAGVATYANENLEISSFEVGSQTQGVSIGPVTSSVNAAVQASLFAANSDVSALTVTSQALQAVNNTQGAPSAGTSLSDDLDAPAEQLCHVAGAAFIDDPANRGGVGRQRAGQRHQHHRGHHHQPAQRRPGADRFDGRHRQRRPRHGPADHPGNHAGDRQRHHHRDPAGSAQRRTVHPEQRARPDLQPTDERQHHAAGPEWPRPSRWTAGCRPPAPPCRQTLPPRRRSCCNPATRQSRRRTSPPSCRAARWARW